MCEGLHVCAVWEECRAVECYEELVSFILLRPH